MTTKKSEGRAGVDAFQHAWLDGLARVLAAELGLDGASAMKAEMVKQAAGTAGGAEPPNGVVFRFRASGPAEGGCALAAPLEVCLRLAQIGGRATTPPAELTAEGRETAAILLLRAAAVVTEETGIELTAAGAEAPSWNPAASAEYRLTAPGDDRFVFTAWIAAELAGGLAPVPGKEPGAAEAPEAAAAPVAVAAAEAGVEAAPPDQSAAGRPAAEAAQPEEEEEIPEQAMAKLGLLMDVPLDVTLRFGARQMVLKDILELGPGGVVELDRGVQDPVELMVAGRVVATGEVVIVDGNYGLRVGQIASPRQRLSGLL